MLFEVDLYATLMTGLSKNDEPKFTSAREKRKEKENNTQNHQKFAMHNFREQ